MPTQPIKLHGDNAALVRRLRELADHMESGETQTTAWALVTVDSHRNADAFYDGPDFVTLIGAMECCKQAVVAACADD